MHRLHRKLHIQLPYDHDHGDLVSITEYTCIYIRSETSCANHSSVGSSTASGMAAAITTGHPTSNWRDETQG